MTEARLGPKASEMSLVDKLGRVSWGLILLTTVIACIGFGMLYSAADGNGANDGCGGTDGTAHLMRVGTTGAE